MQDITELRQAEEALRRSEAYLAEAQRLSHTGTSVFDATRTVYWSEESYRIFGLDPLRGVPDDEAVMSGYMRTIATGCAKRSATPRA